MAGISIQVKGLDTLQNLADKYPAVAESEVNLAINRSLLRVLGNEKQQAPFGVSGLLRDNWQIQMGRFTGRLYSLAKYAADVQYGTAPHFVSAQELLPWAQKKGVNAWAVAKSIAKKGTKANPFFTRAVDASEAGIASEFETAIKNIVAKLSS